MRARDHGKGPPPTDLLVCFPSRVHLSIMPKPICSPSRPSDSSGHHRRRRPSHHNLRNSGYRAHGSPLLWTRNKHNNADISEPTSPKVTCAGQIKVRSKPNNPCKNWQSVMEEIERLHRKKKRRPNWIEAFDFKKDVMQFLTCLRNIRFDFRCFGSIPAAEISSEEEEEEEEDDGDDDEENGEDQGGSGAVFSKWFMILQEENLSKEIRPNFDDNDDEVCAAAPPPPPANALLLMRCRSAPAKSWLEENEEEEEENGKIKEEMNFCEFVVEMGKENRIEDKISRSRSWKR